MTKDLPSLESSLVWSLVNQLGTNQDASDTMNTFLAEYKEPEGDFILDNLDPALTYVPEVSPVKDVAIEFLDSYGDIFWPPSSPSKDQKHRWSTDKDAITDLVSKIFAEKIKLYQRYLKQNQGQDASSDAPRRETAVVEPTGSIKDEAGPPSAITEVQATAAEALKELPANGPSSSSLEGSHQLPYSAAMSMEKADDFETKKAPSATAQATASMGLPSPLPQAEYEYPERGPPPPQAEGYGQVLPPSYADDYVDGPQSRSMDYPELDMPGEAGMPVRFANEDEFRNAVLAALDRANSQGRHSVTGAIQYVRNTMLEATPREAVSNATSNKRVGVVRLCQINDKFMAWIFIRLDGSCLWVKPYKGKVINSVVRYAGWTGEDGVFTDYPVTYGIMTGPDTPERTITDGARPSGSYGVDMNKQKMVRIKHRVPDSDDVKWPKYIKGDSWTMDRAKGALKTGSPANPPCGFCVDKRYVCIVADRGRTCAYCISANRSATSCEDSKYRTSGAPAIPPAGDPGLEFQSSFPEPQGVYGEEAPRSPGSSRRTLTHSGRISRPPPRDEYVDESVSSMASDESGPPKGPPIEVMGEGQVVKRRKHGIHPPGSASRWRLQERHPDSPLLKRRRPPSMDYDRDYEQPPPGAGDPRQAGYPRDGGRDGHHYSKQSRFVEERDRAPAPLTERKAARVQYFNFMPASGTSAPKVVPVADCPDMRSFFDRAAHTWSLLGPQLAQEPQFAAVEVSWPDRRMLIEWMDERDYDRMMSLLRRARGNEMGEVDAVVTCLLRR